MRFRNVFFIPCHGILAALCCILALSTATFLHAQAPAPPAAPAAPVNLIPNGGFENTATFQNYYDGVDALEQIHVPRSNGPVFIEGGDFGHIPFSSSPCFVDVNGDHLPDLVVASPLGYLYWFANIGKKEEPAFGDGHLIQTFVGTAARIDVADWNGDGKMDIIFGNIEGYVNLLLNTGSSGDPKWTTTSCKPRWFAPPPFLPGPQIGYDAPKVKIGTESITIGVYSAPIFQDWNKDGLPDLLVGEGSYSANSIHIWLNTGSRGNPSFKTETSLAFGEGREQLTPSVYDWNGDGIPDLLVGDRDGRVALYLGTADSIKDPKKISPIEFTQFITVDGRERLGSLISVYACDYNADGLPDLVYGTSSGTVMVALGSGKRDDVELSNSTPIKGKDVAKDFKQPATWDNSWLTSSIQYGSPYNGTAPLPAVESKEETPDLELKEGTHAFHLTWFEKFWGWTWCNQGNVAAFASLPNGYAEAYYNMSTTTMEFAMGEDYEFSLWRKGSDMRMSYSLSYVEYVENPKGPKAGPPGQTPHPHDDVISFSSSWGEYRKTWRLEGTKTREINTNGKTNSAWLHFTFYGKGEAWVDDVKLIKVIKR